MSFASRKPRGLILQSLDTIMNTQEASGRRKQTACCPQSCWNRREGVVTNSAGGGGAGLPSPSSRTTCTAVFWPGISFQGNGGIVKGKFPLGHKNPLSCSQVFRKRPELIKPCKVSRLSIRIHREILAGCHRFASGSI